MSQIEKQEFSKRIKLAFTSVKYPGRKIGDKEELRDLLGKTSDQVTIADMKRNHEFIYFNAAGLQYYLPAYLVAMLEHPDELKGVSQMLLEYLAHESEVTNNPCAVWDVFTKEQKLVVLECIAYLAGAFYARIHRRLSPALQRIEDERQKRIQTAIDYLRQCTS